MITIRSSKAGSEVALSCLDVTLTTPRSVYTICSNGSMIDSGSSGGEGLFGAISWPRSRFRLQEGFLIDQQMFLSHDGSAAAFSWALRGDAVIPRSSRCGHSFPVAGHARIAMSASTLTLRKMMDGLPGCQMCEDQKSSRIPMAGTTMNQFGCSIVFASKQQPRLRSRNRSRPDVLNLKLAGDPQY